MSEIETDQELSEIIVSGNCNLLDDYVNKQQRSSENELKINLLNCYHDLWLKRIPIPFNIHSKLIDKIVSMHDENMCDSEEPSQVTPVEYFKIIQADICTRIEELCRINQNLEDSRNMFLFVSRYLAFKINAAKRLYKRLILENRYESSLLKLSFPWEQIQFILCIYVYSFDRSFIEEEEASLYLSVLSEKVICEHLSNFLKHFNSFNIDEEINISNQENNRLKGKLIKNKKKESNAIKIDNETVKSVSGEKKQGLNTKENKMESQYSNLFEDFWLLKNIYSLNIVCEYLNIALSIDFEEDSEAAEWSLERCLLMIGEFTKCTPESPHLSPDLKQIISRLLPTNLQKFIKRIRNDMSHFTDKHLTESTPQYISKNVQLDLCKIKDNINFILERIKYRVIYRFTQSIRQCSTIEDIYLSYPEYIIKGMLHEIKKLVANYNSLTVQFVKDRIDKLKSLKATLSSSEIKAINLIDDKINTKYFEHRLFKTVLSCFSHHLSYLSYLRENGFNSTFYKELLDNLATNLISYSNDQDHILTLVKHDIVILLESKNRDILNVATDIFHYLNFDVRILKGLKEFSSDSKDTNNPGQSFADAQLELDGVLKFLIESLKNQQSNILVEKLNEEVALFTRINDLLKTTKHLAESSTCIDKEAKVQRVIQLIGSQNSELDTKMIQAIKLEDFKTCVDLIKKKYKNRRRCKYENLIWEFTKPENYYLKIKIKLISDFLNSILPANNNGKMKLKLEFHLFNSIDEVIETKYLSMMESTLGKVKELYKDRTSLSEGAAQLKAALEMAFIRILEVSHRFGGGNDKNALLSLRPDILLYCGKSLRNYLAHYDIVYKLIPLKPDFILTSLALKLNQKGINWIPKQNYFLHRGNVDFDCREEELYFGKKAFLQNNYQDLMFTAIKRDKLDLLKHSIQLGADLRGTDIFRRNALQLAFDRCSAECLEYLIDISPILIIDSNKFGKKQYNPFKGSVNIDLTTLPLLLKMIDLIFRFSRFNTEDYEKDNLKKISDVEKFINSKFTTWCNGSTDIVSYLHMAVYTRNIQLINHLYQLGVHYVSATIDVNGDHLIHWAAALGFTDVCKVLLDKKTLINSTDKNGYSALDVALIKAQWETVVFLKSRGALHFTYTDLLTVAIIANQKQWTDQLLELKPFLDNEGSFNIYSFGYALSNCDKDVSLKLISYLAQFRGEKIIDFCFMKTKLLDDNQFNRFICSFIISALCFLGKVNLMKLIFDYLKEREDKFNLGSLKMGMLDYSFFNECPPLDIYDLFKSNPLLHLACLSEGCNEELINFLIENGAEIDEENAFGMTPLHTALNKGNGFVSLFLISKKADVTLRTPSGWTPIHIASSQGLVQVAEKLVQLQVNLEVFTMETQRTPLHLAAQKGHKEIVQILVAGNNRKINEGCRSIIDCQDIDGSTALYLACSNGFLEVASELLNNNADILNLNNKRYSILHAAVGSGCEDVVRLVISKIPLDQKLNIINHFSNDADILSKLVETEDSSDLLKNIINDLQSSVEKIKLFTPLFLAAKLGHNEIVKILITSGADVNLADSLGCTALHVASKHGHIDVIKMLLPHISNINNADICGNTPLSTACQYNHFNIVLLLLQNGADGTVLGFDQLNSSSGEYQDTVGSCSLSMSPEQYLVVLMFAVKQNNKALVEVLLRGGLSANLKNSDGFSAIHVAASTGNLDCLEILVKYEANIESRSGPYLLTPLHLAILFQRINIFKFLLKQGANVNSFGSNFETPLHLAVDMGNLKMVELLIEHGAKLYFKGPYSIPIFFEAVIFDKYEIVNSIIQAEFQKKTSPTCENDLVQLSNLNKDIDKTANAEQQVIHRTPLKCKFHKNKSYWIDFVNAIMGLKEAHFTHYYLLYNYGTLLNLPNETDNNSIPDNGQGVLKQQENTELTNSCLLTEKFSKLSLTNKKNTESKCIKNTLHKIRRGSCEALQCTSKERNTSVNRARHSGLYRSKSAKYLSSQCHPLRDRSLVNMRDFAGLSALHWADILENSDMIDLLKSAGADTNICRW